MKEQLLFKTKTRDDYKIVDFSENYNGKLFSPFFTTIRKHYPNEKKYLTGNKLIARYKEGGFQFFCNVVSREVKLLKEIPPIVIITDTGKDYLEGLKLFKDFYGPEALNLPMEVILFKRESGFFYFKEKDLEFQEKISSIISGEKEPDKVINLSSISPEELQQELSWGKEICEEVEEYKKIEKEKKMQAVPKNLKSIAELKDIKRPLAFLDTETTSLEGEAIEISIIDMEERPLLHTKIRPVTNYIDPGAYAVHKITIQSLQSEKGFEAYRGRIQEIFDKYHIVIYNSAFDLKILQNSCKAAGLPELYIKTENVSCLMNIYTEFYGKRSKLVKALEQEKISISGLEFHSTQDDTKATNRLLKSLFAKIE